MIIPAKFSSILVQQYCRRRW